MWRRRRRASRLGLNALTETHETPTNARVIHPAKWSSERPSGTPPAWPGFVLTTEAATAENLKREKGSAMAPGGEDIDGDY